ncbi:MAG: antibiotic biosynthesis monooxygenase [Gammaproteobacteria bacterium AqS3]|nr:antibiotic biosynthesis monooxygenase [Gammaproteobacteria bacterium AqS3]
MLGYFEPPYYAVIFTSVRGGDTEGYDATAARMFELASQREGFLGVDLARGDIGITISYWRDLEAIRRWREQVEHLEAQRLGRERWYARYRVRIARVEREYGRDSPELL